MLRKILITFIVVFTFGIVALASNIFDTSTIEAEKTDRKLIKTYVYNLETEFADVGMVDIDAGLDATYFVWIGGTTPNAPIYYSVFNPAVLNLTTKAGQWK